MDDKSKFNELEVDSKFRAVLANLGRLSDELDALCLRQAEEGYNRVDIEKLLTRMDNFISKSPVVENARIEGSADVQKIVDLLNQEVTRRLQIIKDNFREADIPDFEDIGKKFAANKTNTMQKELSEFDAASIESKDAITRQNEAADKKVSLEKRIENAEKLKAIYDAHPTMDMDAVIDDIADAQREFSALTKTSGDFKTPEEYRDALTSLKVGSRDRNAYTTDRQLTDLAKHIATLETLKGDSEIADLLTKLEGAIERDPKTKKITKITSLKAIQDATKDVKGFKIEDKISAAKTAMAAADRTALSNLITKKVVFDFYPERKQHWLDLLKDENADIDTIKAEIDAEILSGEKRTELEEYVEQADKDVAKLSDLKLEHRDAKDAERNLKDLNSRHDTSTTRELFGHTLQATKNDGSVMDMRSIDPSKKSHIDKLYSDLISKASEEELDAAFESTPDLPAKVKKPSLLKRFFWKLTNPRTWGSGMGYADYVKENWLKAKIRDEVTEIKKDAAKEDAVWTITPEKKAEIEEADKTRAADARKKEREANIKGGKSTHNAIATAKEDLDRNQNEADVDLEL